MNTKKIEKRKAYWRAYSTRKRKNGITRKNIGILSKSTRATDEERYEEAIRQSNSYIDLQQTTMKSLMVSLIKKYNDHIQHNRNTPLLKSFKGDNKAPDNKVKLMKNGKKI